MLSEHLFASLNSLSLESKENELERTWFVKLKDLDALDDADKIIMMHQVEVFIMKEAGRVGIQRTREVADVGLGQTLGDRNNPILYTIKINQEDGSRNEYTSEVNRDIVEAHEKIADRNLRKTRYIFETENGLKWEIDVPINGPYEGWVKVDLEIPSVDTEIPKFPFEYDKVIDISFGSKVSDEDNKILDDIFKHI